MGLLQVEYVIAISNYRLFATQEDGFYSVRRGGGGGREREREQRLPHRPPVCLILVLSCMRNHVVLRLCVCVCVHLLTIGFSIITIVV